MKKELVLMLNLFKDVDDFLQDLQIEQLQRNANPADAKHLVIIAISLLTQESFLFATY